MALVKRVDSLASFLIFDNDWNTLRLHLARVGEKVDALESEIAALKARLVKLENPE